LHIDASEPLPLPMGRKEYWLKIRDEFSGYSWDYFVFYDGKIINNNNFKKTTPMNEGYGNTC
jgi:hypothetical protein